MKYCDFSKAKVGDKVWDIRYGWGEITCISNKKHNDFRIVVYFGTKYGFYSFNYKGQSYINGGHRPVLFWNEFEIPNEAFEKPKPKLEVDTLVWVWHEYRDEKVLRFFSHFDKYGSIYTFDDGGDSSVGLHNTTEWNEWELYEPKKKD